jgi:hypothetical protein
MRKLMIAAALVLSVSGAQAHDDPIFNTFEAMGLATNTKEAIVCSYPTDIKKYAGMVSVGMDVRKLDCGVVQPGLQVKIVRYLGELANVVAQRDGETYDVWTWKQNFMTPAQINLACGKPRSVWCPR